MTKGQLMQFTAIYENFVFNSRRRQFIIKLNLPYRASEVIFDSEVHLVSEVSPNGEVMGKFNFTC